MAETHGMARSFGTIKAIVRIVGIPSIPRYYATEYREINGIMLPMIRRVYPMDAQHRKIEIKRVKAL
jgi:hypothetical protein